MARKSSSKAQKKKTVKAKKASPKKTVKTVKKPKAKAKPKSKPKPKKKSGRPKGANNVFTPTVKGGIISSLKVGMSYNEAALFNGVSEGGIRYNRRNDAEFSTQCQCARVDLKHHALKVVSKSEDPTVQLRVLEYLRKCADGEKVTVTHQGPEGGAIKTEAVVTRLDVAGMSLKKLKDARKAIRDNLLEESKLLKKETAK